VLSAGDRIRILLELVGGPKFSAEMKAAAAETKGLAGAANAGAVGQQRLGRATEEAGKRMSVFQRRTFLAQQAVFTLRRFAFYGVLALGGLFVGAVKAGYEFNNTMQQAGIVLHNAGLSAKQTKNELAQLFRIALYSPYLLKDVVTATQIMIRLGLTVPQATRTIRNLSDVLAGLPDASAKLNRAAFALGHMSTMGRLTGIVLTQLGRDNVPMAAALVKYFHLTGDQLRNVSKLGIPAAAALAALNRYISTSPQYAGLAQKISLRSLGGLFAAFRDFFSQTSGLILKPLYTGVQNFMYSIIKPGGLLDRMSKAAASGGSQGALTVLSRGLGGGDVLAKGLVNLGHTLTYLWRILIGSWIPALIISARVISTIVPVLRLVNFFLGILAKHTTILRFILVPMAALWLVIHLRMMGVYIVTKLLQFATFGLFKAETRVFTIERLRTLWQLRSIKAMRLFLFATTATTIATNDLNKGMKTTTVLQYKQMSGWAKLGRFMMNPIKSTKALYASLIATLPLLANPIFLIAVAVTALIATLVILYFKWKAFHDFVNRTARWIMNHWTAVRVVLSTVLGPMAIMVDIAIALIRYWQGFLDILNKIAGIFKAIKGFLGGASFIPGPSGTGVVVPPQGKSGGGHSFGIGSDIQGAAKWLWHHPIFGFASGGVTPGGISLVGEHGPELAVFPSGTRIIPKSEARTMVAARNAGGSGGSNQPQIIQLVVGKKVLAEVVAQINSDARADK
jgi:hypothetical protein